MSFSSTNSPSGSVASSSLPSGAVAGQEDQGRIEVDPKSHTSYPQVHSGSGEHDAETSASVLRPDRTGEVATGSGFQMAEHGDDAARAAHDLDSDGPSDDLAAEPLVDNTPTNSARDDLHISEQRTLATHPVEDRKRRLTSSTQEAGQQRTRPGQPDVQENYTSGALPYRSISIAGSSSRGDAADIEAGLTYETAIDITSSPPDPVFRASSSRPDNDEDMPFRPETKRKIALHSSANGPDAPGNSHPLRGERNDRALVRSSADAMEHSSDSIRHSSVTSSAIAGAGCIAEDSRSSELGQDVRSNRWQAMDSTFSGSELNAAFDEGRLSGIMRDDTSERYFDLSLPRWQPDMEVSSCPICGTVFGFFYRKHHCRKCGRVVCASCSPHRITIPRQFIVRPPDSTHQSLSSPIPPSQFIDLTGGERVPLTSAINPALGGGEEVRLCNPCVPDPNPNPLGYSTARPRGHRPSNSLPSTMGHRHSTEAREEGSSRRGRAYRPEYLETLGRQVRQSLLNEIEQNRPRRATDLGQRPLAGVESRRQPAAPPAVSEQDVCPICGRSFPPLSAEETMEAREAHIRTCIENYAAPSAPRSAQPQAGSLTSPTTSRQPPPLPAPVSRMVEFAATEKDCFNADGTAAECTICMEDYQVGETLVRLECFCKYHKPCLVKWFGHKAQCPVHIRS